MDRLDPLVETACQYTGFVWLAFTTMLFLFALAVLSLAFVEPGTAAFTITIVNFALIVPATLVSGGLFLACKRRRRALLEK